MLAAFFSTQALADYSCTNENGEDCRPTGIDLISPSGPNQRGHELKISGEVPGSIISYYAALNDDGTTSDNCFIFDAASINIPAKAGQFISAAHQQGNAGTTDNNVVIVKNNSSINGITISGAVIYDYSDKSASGNSVLISDSKIYSGGSQAYLINGVTHRGSGDISNNRGHCRKLSA